jgi:hypothetical protein
MALQHRRLANGMPAGVAVKAKFLASLPLAMTEPKTLPVPSFLLFPTTHKQALILNILDINTDLRSTIPTTFRSSALFEAFLPTPTP